MPAIAHARTASRRIGESLWRRQVPIPRGMHEGAPGKGPIARRCLCPRRPAILDDMTEGDPNRGALRTLDIVLESGAGKPREGTAPSNGARQRVISLLRCVVLAQHLDHVLGAIERAIPSKTLSGLQIPLIQGELEVNGRRTMVVRIGTAGRLKRLRARVLNAIMPAVVALDSSPSVSDFLSPTIGPIAVDEVRGHDLVQSLLRIQRVSVYTTDGASDRGRKLLRCWTAPAPQPKRRVS